MKKILFLVATVFTMFSCSSDDVTSSEQEEVYVNGKGVIETSGPVAVSLPDGTDKVLLQVGDKTSEVQTSNNVLTFKSNVFNVVKILSEESELIESVVVTPASSDISVSKSTTTFEINNKNKAFISKFPEEVNNGEGYPLDFVYCSKGEYFDIYPIYSNTSNKVTVGIFWYDNNNALKTQDIWQMDDEWYAKGTKASTRPYHYTVLPVTTTGIKVFVPKGISFGFYTYTHTDGNKRYSMKDLNTSCGTKHSQYGRENTHAVTYNEDGYTYIGFDDGHSKVADYNDLVLTFNPEQKIIPNPTPDIIDSLRKDTVIIIDEDYIHVTDKDPYVDVEARLRDPYPYFRFNITIPTDSTFEIDLSERFGEFILPQDDLRIVGANDVTIAYIEDGETYNENGIKIKNNYPHIYVSTDVTVKDGPYTLKVEGIPVKETWKRLVELIKEISDSAFDWTTVFK